MSSSFVVAATSTTVTGFAAAVARSTSASSSAGAVVFGSATVATARRTASGPPRTCSAIERATCVAVGLVDVADAPGSRRRRALHPGAETRGHHEHRVDLPVLHQRRPSGSDGPVRISIAPLSCTAGRTWSTKMAETSDRSASTMA